MDCRLISIVLVQALVVSSGECLSQKKTEVEFL